MYILINGSQKKCLGNSRKFLDSLSEYLDEYEIYDLKQKKYKEIINSIRRSNVIVLAFPIYVDAPNSLTLSFLDYIYDNRINLEGKKVYLIINCGFREGEQNINAREVLKCWCEKVGAIYYGSILIGAGEVIGNSKYKFISRNALKGLKQFSIAVSNGVKTKDIITTIDIIKNNLYCKFANYSWNIKAKSNKLSKSDIMSI